MQKNAYEIRTKILKMAKEQVNEEYYQKKDNWDSKETKDGPPPKAPTIVDIMRTADTMYTFIKKQE